MSSNSALAFRRARDRARLLVAASDAGRGQSHGLDQKDVCLHAGLAMLVAAWETYLENLIGETHRLLSDPMHQRMSAVLSLLSAISVKEVKKFNTPNAENSRNLLLIHTGFDPLNAWHWARGHLNAIQTRQRLDEILRVRHCFAHGASIPTDIYWAKNRKAHGHLTKTVLKMADRFLSDMVAATDTGMIRHLANVFGVVPQW